MSGRPRRVRVAWGRVLSLLALLGLWQLASAGGWVRECPLPTPGAVALAACALWSTGELQHHLTVSLGRVTQCLALGVSSGIALAIVAGLSKAGEEVVGAPSQMLRMLAMVRLFIPLRGTCLSLKP